MRCDDGLRSDDAGAGELMASEGASEGMSDAGAGARYDPVFDRVYERISHLERTLRREREEAPGLVRRLIGQPLARQLLIVCNTGRFHTAGLCEQLLDRSWSLRFDEPAETRDLAELAVSVAEALDPESYGRCLVQDLCGRAWCHLGNGRRILADLRGAGEALQKAERYLAEGSGDTLERGFLLRTRAVLLLDQRRLDESEVLVDRALDLYRSERFDHEFGMALMAKSYVCSHRGDAEGEIVHLQEALPILDPAREPRLKLVGVHNLVSALHGLGRDAEALALLIRWRFLYFELGDQAFLFRLHWLEGMIARGLARPELAEGALQEARRGFIELSLPYEMALVSLDLAEVYLESGKTREVPRLASEAVAFFQSRGIHREALAALLLFQEASRRDRVTLGLVREVGERLEASRRGPELQGRSGSDA